MRSLNQLLIGFGLGLTLLVGACKEDKGGFGEPDTKQPGVRVQKVEKPVEDAVPDFSKALQVSSAFDQKSGQVIVNLDIKDGFHAYAPGEEVGIPVKLNIAEEGGWTLSGDPEIPAGKVKDLGELGKSLILEGMVPIKSKVEGGQGAVKGHVRVQVCTKKACDRPRKHPFQVAMQ